ncbi:MAG: hypothetical protein ABIT16_05630 [Croceibacterium sp.]
MIVESTSQCREHELAALLERITQEPNHEWPEERRRIAVLQRMMAGPTYPLSTR